jgi:hypothetical protein
MTVLPESIAAYAFAAVRVRAVLEGTMLEPRLTRQWNFGVLNRFDAPSHHRIPRELTRDGGPRHPVRPRMSN